MKKIGIIGSGVVAQTLAKGFLGIGFEVMMGTRNAEKLKDLEQIQIGTVAETVDYADLLVLSVKGTVALDALKDLPLAGKTIIDTTNPIADAAPINGVIQYFTDINKSLCETLQQAHPEAKFVKAFNSVGAHLMVNPNYNGVKPSMFICGNDADAKSKVAEILEQFGWEVEDMGAVQAAGAIEALCVLWCIPGINENKWMHAFKLLK